MRLLENSERLCLFLQSEHLTFELGNFLLISLLNNSYIQRPLRTDFGVLQDARFLTDQVALFFQQLVLILNFVLELLYCLFRLVDLRDEVLVLLAFQVELLAQMLELLFLKLDLGEKVLFFTADFQMFLFELLYVVVQV